MLLLIEAPSATEDLILQLAMIAACLAAVVTGIFAYRNNRKR